jgi:ribosome-associated protein
MDELLDRDGWEEVRSGSDGSTTAAAASPQAIAWARIAARAAADKLARDIVAIDVTSRLPLTDAFLIVTGMNQPHVGAITDAIEERLFAEGVKAVHREGDQEARWILLDFGDLIVHVQLDEARTLFALDRLWHDCPTIELDPK